MDRVSSLQFNRNGGALEAPPPHPLQKLLLTEEEAADLTGFTPRFFQERRYKGDGPQFVRISARAVRYRIEDLEAWARDRLRTSTSDRGDGLC